jgi:hypothetical protein
MRVDYRTGRAPHDRCPNRSHAPAITHTIDDRSTIGSQQVARGGIAVNGSPIHRQLTLCKPAR